MQVPGQGPGQVSINAPPLPQATPGGENFEEALTAATGPITTGTNNGNTGGPAALPWAPNPNSVADPGKVKQQGGGKGRKPFRAVSAWLSKSGVPEKLKELVGGGRFTHKQLTKAMDAVNEDAALEEELLPLGEDVVLLVPEDIAPADPLTGSIVGKPSTLASSVNADLRQELGIPDEVPSAVDHVVVLSDADFLNVAAEENVEGAARLDAFTVSNPDGTVRMIAVRESAENRETLAHELLHAYTAPAFKAMAGSFLVDPEQPYSNLGEEVVDLLVWLFMGNDGQAPPAQGAGIAGQIFKDMDADVFYRAFVLGDESAVDAFRQAAESFSELTVVAEEFPIVQAKVQGVAPSGGPSPPAPIVIEMGKERGVLGFVRGAFANLSGRRTVLYLSMLAVTVPLSFVIDPRILAVANGLGFLLRGIGTAAPLVFPRIKARTVAAWQAMTFVLNGASHDHAASGFNPAHWNAPGQPYNTGYAFTDERSLVDQVSVVATGQDPASKLEQRASLVVLNASNLALGLEYSGPAGPGALAPTLLFGGGAAYLLAKTTALDILDKFANSSKVPPRIRASAAAWRQKIERLKDDKIPKWMIAVGLMGFGADYLIQNALPRLQAQHVNVTSPQQVLTAVAVNLLGLGASVALPGVVRKLRLPKGALAYPDAEATGTPAGLFKKDDSVSLTGNTVIDVKHHLWVEVTGTELGGGTLTAWVDARDLPRPHISVTDPNGAPLHIESVSSGIEATLPSGTPLTLTGKYQKDRSGDVWVEVKVKVRRKTVTGWIDVGTMGPATSPTAGGVITAPPSP